MSDTKEKEIDTVKKIDKVIEQIKEFPVLTEKDKKLYNILIDISYILHFFKIDIDYFVGDLQDQIDDLYEDED